MQVDVGVAQRWALFISSYPGRCCPRGRNHLLLSSLCSYLLGLLPLPAPTLPTSPLPSSPACIPCLLSHAHFSLPAPTLPTFFCYPLSPCLLPPLPISHDCFLCLLLPCMLSPCLLSLCLLPPCLLLPFLLIPYLLPLPVSSLPTSAPGHYSFSLLPSVRFFPCLRN